MGRSALIMVARLPEPPTRPEAAACCHRGCCPCIFDYYQDALGRWMALATARGLDPEAILAARAAACGEPPAGP